MENTYKKTIETPALLEKKQRLEELRGFKQPLSRELFSEHLAKYEEFQEEKKEKALKIK